MCRASKPCAWRVERRAPNSRERRPQLALNDVCSVAPPRIDRPAAELHRAYEALMRKILLTQAGRAAQWSLRQMEGRALALAILEWPLRATVFAAQIRTKMWARTNMVLQLDQQLFNYQRLPALRDADLAAMQVCGPRTNSGESTHK